MRAETTEPSTAPGTQWIMTKSLLNARNVQLADEADWLHFMGIWSQSFMKYLILEKPLGEYSLSLTLFL